MKSWFNLFREVTAEEQAQVTLKDAEAQLLAARAQLEQAAAAVSLNTTRIARLRAYLAMPVGERI